MSTDSLPNETGDNYNKKIPKWWNGSKGKQQMKKHLFKKITNTSHKKGKIEIFEPSLLLS